MYTQTKPNLIKTWDVWLSLVTEQQLRIWACAVMIEYAQIVSCCSATNDNHTYLVYSYVIQPGKGSAGSAVFYSCWNVHWAS